jgi:hypothetical protein
LVVITHFRALNKQKNKKKKEKRTTKKNGRNNKNILVRRIYQNVKEIFKDWLTKIKIYKIRKYDTIFSNDKGLFSKEKFKIRCLRTYLEFLKV